MLEHLCALTCGACVVLQTIQEDYVRSEVELQANKQAGNLHPLEGPPLHCEAASVPAWAPSEHACCCRAPAGRHSAEQPAVGSHVCGGAPPAALRGRTKLLPQGWVSDHAQPSTACTSLSRLPVFVLQPFCSGAGEHTAQLAAKP